MLGIDKIALKLFESYLTKRTFAVEINKRSSNKAEMLRGVPQGTILSPILFVIYTIEIHHIPENMGFLCTQGRNEKHFL